MAGEGETQNDSRGRVIFHYWRLQFAGPHLSPRPSHLRSLTIPENTLMRTGSQGQIQVISSRGTDTKMALRVLW